MKSNSWPALLLLTGLVVGYLAAGGSAEKSASGQAAVAAQNLAPRFQIQAWAHGSDNHGRHGCYILDTGTGELWHSNLAGTPAKIANELPKEKPQGRRPNIEDVREK